MKHDPTPAATVYLAAAEAVNLGFDPRNAILTYSPKGLESYFFQLWRRFTNGEDEWLDCTREAVVLGLLLLAEIMWEAVE